MQLSSYDYFSIKHVVHMFRRRILSLTSDNLLKDVRMTSLKYIYLSSRDKHSYKSFFLIEEEIFFSNCGGFRISTICSAVVLVDTYHTVGWNNQEHKKQNAAMPLFKICGLEAREKQFVIAIKKSNDTRGEKCECHSGNKQIMGNI